MGTRGEFAWRTRCDEEIFGQYEASGSKDGIKQGSNDSVVNRKEKFGNKFFNCLQKPKKKGGRGNSNAPMDGNAGGKGKASKAADENGELPPPPVNPIQTDGENVLIRFIASLVESSEWNDPKVWEKHFKIRINNKLFSTWI